MPNNWTKEEDSNWTEELQKQMSQEACKQCGSNKITHTLMGKPYQAYVEWNRKKSQELGWTTLSLSGCTKSGSDFCSDCQAPFGK